LSCRAALGVPGAALRFALWAADMVAGGWILPDSHIYALGFYVDTLAFAFRV
jgi:hypothetical protein